MKMLFFFLVFILSTSISAREWKCLKEYKKVTKNKTLLASDWLKQDRKKNTKIWQNANSYNLNNNLPKEYETIEQRKAFYAWYSLEIQKKGHQVIWPKMAFFISKKMNLSHESSLTDYILEI